jgi:hypothetical protein
MLVERWTPQRAFSVTPLTAGLAAVLAELGGLGVRRLAVRRGRDERAVTALHTTSAAGPVAGTPGGLACGTGDATRRPRDLVDEKADVVDVTATVVDLAVRRHLRIEELEQRRLQGRDWLLTRLDDGPDDLVPYEGRLLDALFRSSRAVRVSDLKDSFHDQMASLRTDLYDEVVGRGWYRVRPDRTRLLWYGMGRRHRDHVWRGRAARCLHHSGAGGAGARAAGAGAARGSSGHAGPDAGGERRPATGPRAKGPPRDERPATGALGGHRADLLHVGPLRHGPRPREAMGRRVRSAGGTPVGRYRWIGHVYAVLVRGCSSWVVRRRDRRPRVVVVVLRVDRRVGDVLSPSSSSGGGSGGGGGGGGGGGW